jgi:hypothetical protein
VVRLVVILWVAVVGGVHKWREVVVVVVVARVLH